MAKIHRNDMPVQHPTQTITLPKKPEPAAPKATAPQFYDQNKDADYEAPHPAKGRDNTAKAGKAKSKKDLAYTIAMVVFAVIFLVSGGLLVKRFFDDKKTENEFSDLQSMIDVAATPAPAEDSEPSNAAKFAALKDQNSDFMGWISIEGTSLDFPVMYAPNNKDYYLKHDFKHQYSDYGVPYLDEKTTIGANAQSNNLIVYGHNMKTGTIFGCLTEYKKAAYYQEHPYIEFDTLYGDAKYEVFAAFAIDVVQDTSFVYNQYVDMDEDTYNDYVAEVIRRSDVDSGIRPEYGEQLLTLSTCEYSSANGRYVVVARKVSS